ncbi:MAG: hypothetical protein R8L07_09815 [Alphaproteobacteria bacterium]|nr:hypothetical protein [Alphaproteobacteria bacterium]
MLAIAGSPAGMTSLQAQEVGAGAWQSLQDRALALPQGGYPNYARIEDDPYLRSELKDYFESARRQRFANSLDNLLAPSQGYDETLKPWGDPQVTTTIPGYQPPQRYPQIDPSFPVTLGLPSGIQLQPDVVSGADTIPVEIDVPRSGPDFGDFPLDDVNPYGDVVDGGGVIPGGIDVPQTSPVSGDGIAIAGALLTDADYEAYLRSTCVARASSHYRGEAVSSASSEVNEACFSGIDELPDQVKSSGILSLVGFLVWRTNDETEVGFCTAMRVDDTRILTAKHCFYHRDDGRDGEARFTSAHFEDGKIRFYLLADLNSSYPVGNPGGAFLSAFGTKDDTLIVPVATNGTSVPGYAVRSPSQLGFASIIGLSSFERKSDWRDRVKVTLDKTCFVTMPDADGCVVHACNTSGGFSGAPIFGMEASDNGALRPVVFGVHSKAGREETECGVDEYAFVRVSNTAAPVDAASLGIENP